MSILRQTEEKICNVCGKQYWTDSDHTFSPSLFCSEACKEHADKVWLDNEE
jgi:endogenous inhibitor of DNA gyrase (YacG/DUF329 family)